jgi:hypothetical protein
MAAAHPTLIKIASQSIRRRAPASAWPAAFTGATINPATVPSGPPTAS